MASSSSEKLVDIDVAMLYDQLMEINHSTDQIRIGALKGLAFRQFRDGQLTALDLMQRLAELKLQELAR